VTSWSHFYTFNLWLHILSFALWIGGIFFFLLVFGPAVGKLPPADGIPALDRGRKALEAISWIAINLLIITGVLNLVLRGMAAGFQLGPVYYWVLAVKLLLFSAMFFHHALQVFKYGSRIASLTTRSAEDFRRGSRSEESRRVEALPEPLLTYWKKWFLLLKINAALGPIIVLLGLGLSRT